MWSQFAISSAAAALFLGCGGSPAPPRDLSDHSSPGEGPDLTLHGVAFARLSDGRIAARGTARVLAYYRAGGRLDAATAAASLHPDADTGYAMFGDVLVAAPRVTGDVGSKRGVASGGVAFRTARGDHGDTDRLLWDGPADRLSGDRPVAAQGPGYVVHSQGFSARADGSDITLTGGVVGTLQPETPAPASSGASRATSGKPRVTR